MGFQSGGACDVIADYRDHISGHIIRRILEITESLTRTKVFKKLHDESSSDTSS